MVNCIIIEDEPLAIKKLAAYIDKLPSLNLLASFHSPLPAITYLKTQPVDLIFLDIEMKELTGIQFLESVSTDAQVIITTAYEQYALKGYEFQVNDYLLKPISFERFLKACDKIFQTESQHAKSTHGKIFVKTEYRLQGIDTANVLYIEGTGDYKRISTAEQDIMTLETFSVLLQKLPPTKFCRVHNSFIVPLDKIEKIERNRIFIHEKVIPISESFRKAFYDKLNV